MSGIRSTVNRTNPVAGAGTNYHAVLQADSLIDAVSPQMVERVGLQWGPLSFCKIAAAVTSLGDYPAETLDGSVGGTPVNVSSSSGVTLTMSGTMTWNPTGLLLMFQSLGTGNDYTWYKVVAQPSGTTLTLNRAPATISSTSAFKFFIDCEGLNALFIKSEYSASTATCDLIPAFYDTGRTPAGTPAARAAYRFPSTLVTPGNNGDNTDATSGGYHGDAVSVNCAGATGAKVRLHAAPTSGNVSLWACAS